MLPFHIGEKAIPFNRAISESIGYGPMPTKEQSAVALRSFFITGISNSRMLRGFLEQAAVIAGCPLSGVETLECLRQASLGNLLTPNIHLVPLK